MNAQEKYLNRIAKLTETGSDYAAAKLLGITRQRISNYRTGRNHFDNEMAFKIAVMLDMNPSELIAELSAERARTPEKKKFWQGQFRRLHGATGLTLFALLFIFPSLFNPVEASTLNISRFIRTISVDNIHYAKWLDC
ncbi:MAG TPA: XRE family transcriptional regulator [Gammaproteobacteria bacterium]|nr:XRE family transcriptional regulator [Gammaproteobacteria bacterium]